jgi:outer membrane receptor for ferrienterochelin and colicin
MLQGRPFQQLGTVIEFNDENRGFNYVCMTKQIAYLNNEHRRISNFVQKLPTSLDYTYNQHLRFNIRVKFDGDIAFEHHSEVSSFDSGRNSNVFTSERYEVFATWETHPQTPDSPI